MWNEVQERVAPKSIYNASVRLHQRKNSKPSLIVALRTNLVNESKWKAKDSFGLAVGDGENKGKVRIIRNAKKPIAVARGLKTALTLDFGYIAQLGDRGATKADAVGIVIDANTIEIQLPQLQFDEDDAAEGAPAPKPQPSTTSERNPNDLVTRNGITVDLHKESEEIAYRGKAMDLTARQAIFAAELVKAMPNAVTRGFVETKIWGLRPPPGASMALDQIVMDLGKGLKAVGLQLKTMGGSFALAVV